MQFKVPQSIDLEDKIVGPLTLKQFAYILIGGMIDYLSYFFLKDVYLFVHYDVLILVILVSSTVAIALAFVKIQDQPFAHFLTALASYMTRPKIRLWQKDIEDPDILRQIKPTRQTNQPIQFTPKKITKSQLDQLSSLLDTHGVEAPKPPAKEAPNISKQPVATVQPKEGKIGQKPTR